MTVRVHAAAALSEHPLATHAVGECVGQLLEEGGPDPDLVVLALTAPQLGALEDIVRAVRRLLRPRTLIGSTAESVLAGFREVEGHGALSMFAVWSDPPSDDGVVRPVRLMSIPGVDGPDVTGLEQLAGRDGTLVLLADPYSSPVEHVLGRVRAVAPDLVVVGGMASSARHAGGNRLVLDAALHADGMVGALLPAELASSVVSQGCRAIGEPMTVTSAERHVVKELAGRPALERLMEVVDGLSPEDRALAANGLHVGRLVDEHRVELGRGDFLVRNVLGADRDLGAIAIGDEVDLGSTLQFQVRDARSADEDLRAVMEDAGAAVGGLVFTCNGRGTRLFDVPHHDAAVISEALGGAPVSGMFCAGEFGPVGHSNFVHTLSTSVLLVGASTDR